MIYKRILSSTLPLIITILLFLVVGNYGIGRVRDLRSQISQARQEKAVLIEKLNILRTISEMAVSGSKFAASALPGENPVLLARAQIKELATQNSVVLSNLKSDLGGSSVSGLSTVGLNFDLSGARSEIIAFLKAIGDTAPVSLVDKIAFSESMGESSATVSVKTFWAAFPQILPSVTESIMDLTAEEKNTLDKISALAQPTSFELLIGSEGGEMGEGGGRPNPFLP